MKRYHFRLDPVLRVRRVQEDQAAARLAGARADELAARAALDARHAAIAARRRPAGPTSADALVAAATVWQAELADLARRGSEVAQAADATERARVGWAQAARSVRGLELLDERHRAEHALEAAREEAARVDDLVVARFGRAALDGGRR